MAEDTQLDGINDQLSRLNMLSFFLEINDNMRAEDLCFSIGYDDDCLRVVDDDGGSINNIAWLEVI